MAAHFQLFGCGSFPDIEVKGHQKQNYLNFTHRKLPGNNLTFLVTPDFAIASVYVYTYVYRYRVSRAKNQVKSEFTELLKLVYVIGPK